ncbi:PDZ domain-containing protein [bacterium]|nr:PDZ domain-containing protein [bacterium]
MNKIFDLNTSQLRVAASFFALTLGVLFSLNVQAQQSVARQEQQAIQQAVALASPSIVRIETVGGVDLVGDVLTGSGPTTGVVVSEDGYIITSRFNFFNSPASVLVTIPQNGENKRFAAEIVSNDESKMLTLLKVEASGLQPISALPKDQILVGQRSIALGRTFDVTFPNISKGIVSALNRVNGKAIQTDAKTSPINYGGPLIDLHGRCLGIIVPLSPQQSGETAGVEWYDSGIGFAVPMEDISRVLDRMQTGETLKPGLLGVSFEALGPLSGEAKVLRVRPQSPADQAGIQIDDVITEIDGTAIDRIINLRQVLGNRYAGETVNVIVKRGEESIQSEIKLIGELTDYQFLSLGIQPARAPLFSEDDGVAIRFVFPDSAAEKAGFKPGDRIVSIDGEEIGSASDLAQFITTKEVDQEVEIAYERDGESQAIQLKLSAFPNGDGLTNIPPADVPPGDVPEDLKLGRFNQKLTGSERTFWVNVPENYNPEYSNGMLVWIHPSGDTMEADVLQFWKDFSAERGLILVGPRAEDLSGWSATDENHVKDVADWVMENYSIDQKRVAVMGLEDSGVLATRLAFKYRDLFRGLISMESPLRIPPPDSNPEQRLMIAFAAATETRSREGIEKSVEILRNKNFPTALIDSEEAGKFSFDLVNSIIQWLDTLDRI